MITVTDLKSLAAGDGSDSAQIISETLVDASLTLTGISAGQVQNDGFVTS